MSDKPIHVDQDLIDLLAEDALDSKERAEVLANLDLDPNGWKRCALSLLETQALSRSLKGFQSNTLGVVPSSASNSTLSSNEVTSKNRTIPRRPVKSNVPRLGKRTLGKRALWKSALAGTLAAILLVGVGIGIGQKMPAPNSVVNDLEAPTLPAHPIVHQLAASDPVLLQMLETTRQQVGVSDAQVIAFLSTIENDRSRVYPIIESRSLAKYLNEFTAPKVPIGMARHLAQKGWKVNSQKQFVSVKHPGGKQQTIPVGMLNYQFIGNETF